MIDIDAFMQTVGYLVTACLLMTIPILTGVSLVAWAPEITVCLFVVSFVEMIGLVVVLSELHYFCDK